MESTDERRAGEDSVTRCPKCGSVDLYRSTVKSAWERFRVRVTGRRPFRCLSCQWRGWAADLGLSPVLDVPEGSFDAAVRGISNAAAEREPSLGFDAEALDRSIAWTRARPEHGAIPPGVDGEDDPATRRRG